MAVRPDCSDLFPPDQWSVYEQVVDLADRTGIRYAVGGGGAVAAYTGTFRPTKDIDLYVLPESRDAMIRIAAGLGLEDLYDRSPYDRRWIHRTFTGDVIVDIIWAMANQRARVDEDWLSKGPQTCVRNKVIRLVPLEELIWSKLYVLQRDRCDWPDVMNLLLACGGSLDWDRLLGRLGEDEALLRGLVAVFSWLAPERSLGFPQAVWEKLDLRPPEAGRGAGRDSAQLLDSRPWLVAA